MGGLAFSEQKWRGVDAGKQRDWRRGGWGSCGCDVKNITTNTTTNNNNKKIKKNSPVKSALW